MTNEQDIEGQFNVMANLPPAPVVSGPNADTVWCVHCKKAMHVSEVKSYWSGLCHAKDLLCHGCRLMFPKHALVICLKCREVVGRMAPERLASGFVIEPLKCYHIQACPRCDRSVVSSVLLEGENYFRTFGIKGPTHKTLIGRK